jgi:hypothetical protein
VNLERSDLAFRTAFPILITNALSWFAGQPGELEPSIAAGQMTRLKTVDESFQTAESGTKGAATTAGTVTEGMAAGTPLNGSAEALVLETAATVATLPDRRRFLISPSDNAFPLLSHQVGPLSKVGLWSVIEKVTTEAAPMARRPGEQPETESDQQDFNDKLVQRIAVNLADANETDLRPWDGPVSNQNSAIISGSWFTRPIWFYLIVTALLLSTLEWFLYQRRFIS